MPHFQQLGPQWGFTCVAWHTHLSCVVTAPPPDLHLSCSSPSQVETSPACVCDVQYATVHHSSPIHLAWLLSLPTSVLILGFLLRDWRTEPRPDIRFELLGKNNGTTTHWKWPSFWYNMPKTKLTEYTTTTTEAPPPQLKLHLPKLKLHPLHCHTEGLHYKWCLPCYTGSCSCWRHNWRGNTWVFIRECTTTLLTSLVVMVRLQELQGLLGVCSHLLLHTTQRSKVDGCLSPNSGLLALFSFTTCGTNLCMDIALQVTNEDVNKARQGIISFSESVSQLWRKI